MMIARHVLFHPDLEKNVEDKFRKGIGEAKCEVLPMGTATYKRYRNVIQKAIDEKHTVYYRSL